MANEDKKTVPATGIETTEEAAAIAAAQEALINEQAAEIEKLKADVAKANKSKRPVSTEPKTFKLKGKTYPFHAPQFTVPGFGVVTATQAKNNPEILGYLVEVGAGDIKAQPTS